MYAIELRFGLDDDAPGPSVEVFTESARRFAHELAMLDGARLEHLWARRTGNVVHLVCYTMASDRPTARRWGALASASIVSNLAPARFLGLRVWPDTLFDIPSDV